MAIEKPRKYAAVSVGSKRRAISTAIAAPDSVPTPRQVPTLILPHKKCLNELLIAWILLYVVLVPTATAWDKPSSCTRLAATVLERAGWMRGGWGIRIVLPAGHAQGGKMFRTHTLIRQLAALRTASWVFMNLTAGAQGGLLTTQDDEVAGFSPQSVPPRELLSPAVDGLLKERFRVGLYVASQGPNLDFFSADKLQHLRDRNPRLWQSLRTVEREWKSFAAQKGKDSRQLFTDLIRRQSRRYGSRIAAWWFDHGRGADPYALSNAARDGNSLAAVAWNGKHRKTTFSGNATSPPGGVWLLTRDGSFEDFTDGHVTITQGPYGKAPWWKGNEKIIKQIEGCVSVDGAVPHLFIPLQNTWRGGPDSFPASQAVDWTRRVIAAHGAITWAAALATPEFSRGYIRQDVYAILQRIDQALGESGAVSTR